MEKLNIVMPMAGEGKRFREGGYAVPKPLIELEGIPLFKRAIDSLNYLDVAKEYFFIVRQEHIAVCHIDEVIRHYYPEAHIYPIAQTTRGAVETCMYGSADFKVAAPLVVLDCDLEFRCLNFERFVQSEILLSAQERVGGGLISFHSGNERYSYALLDDRGFVCKTAEKEVISDHALAGAYYFSSAGIFTEAARLLLEQTDIGKPEYYLSLLYNILLKQGYAVQLFDVDSYLSNGTPEELRREL